MSWDLKTVKSLEAYVQMLPVAVPLAVRTRRHVFAIKDRKVHDWQAGRKFRIRNIFLVVPVEFTKK